MEEFSKQWTGIVLIAEPSSSAGEVNYAAKRKQERWKHLRLPALAALGTLIPLGLVFLSPSAFSWFWVGLFLLKLFGLGLGTALLSLHIVGKQSFASSFCQLGDKSDCNAILNSPAAMLWGLISWAEIGFLYYAGGLLCLLLALVSAHPLGVVPFLSVLSWLALPYPIFSVYYQWRIAKQWCPLCLAVQGVLVAEALLYAAYSSPLEWVSPLAATGMALLGFGLVLAGWLLAKPLWLNSLQLRKTKRELSKFKHNPEAFEQFLRQQPAMPPLTPALKALRLGATEAEAQHTLVVVTNPYCGPCAKAHQQLEELMAIHPKLCIYLIFTTCTEERIKQVVGFLLSLKSSPTEIFTNALNQWYSQSDKDFYRWSQLFPSIQNLPTSNVDAVMDAHCVWTYEAKIKGTPTIFLNGNQLPAIYSLTDLKYLLSILRFSKKDLAEST